MKIKITVTQDSLITDPIVVDFADRISRVMNVSKTPTNGKVIYEFDNLPRDLFTNEQFNNMLINEHMEFEGLILYTVCQPLVMDMEVPVEFPKSVVPATLDEEGEVVTEARQATIAEYFMRSSVISDKAFVELWPKDQGNGHTRLCTSFTPNRVEIGMFIQFLTPYLLDEILTKEGRDAKVAELNEEA